MRVCEVRAQMITDPRPLEVDDHSSSFMGIRYDYPARLGQEGA